MQRLLASEKKVLDVLDAGTTMRFLIAWSALTGKNRILTGTPRMKERPVRILVDALRSIGAKMEYLENEGFPPVETKGFPVQIADHIQIRGDVSSQYISALLMLAPTLPRGLKITITGKTGSKPYIDMTLQLMRKFGAEAAWISDRDIEVKPGKYKITDHIIEPDWSGASYWYAMLALAKEGEVHLPGLLKDSLQGDRAIVQMMEPLGVQTEFTSEGVWLSKKNRKSKVEIDFSDHPDLAQTIAVACAGTGTTGIFSGLESLRIKETDRIAALQTELRKTGATLKEQGKGRWLLTPPERMPQDTLQFATYDDHRMAMAFAPFAMLTTIEIGSPEVVNKSYPGFWDDMKSAGFAINVI
jgi:3-phosphoshikimate 1-carboxyvinyltransferase